MPFSSSLRNKRWGIILTSGHVSGDRWESGKTRSWGSMRGELAWSHSSQVALWPHSLSPTLLRRATPKWFPSSECPLFCRLRLCSIHTKEHTHTGCWAAVPVWWTGGTWRERVPEGTRRSSSFPICFCAPLGALPLCSSFTSGRRGRGVKWEDSENTWWRAHVGWHEWGWACCAHLFGSPCHLIWRRTRPLSSP